MQPPYWEHYPHEADMGVRGVGRSLGEAFEQAALALTAVITDLALVMPVASIEVTLEPSDDEMLLVDWLNAIVYQMATSHMLFSLFEVRITDDGKLHGVMTGEILDMARHQPAVEVKGATFTDLKVHQKSPGEWIAQCVVDV